MFMLMGIVKKNGIMIVDFAQQRVEQGLANDQAIHEASTERFRPIVMTTLAALMGALANCPGLRAAVPRVGRSGWSSSGGSWSHSSSTLYVTPAIFLLSLEEFQKNVLNRTSFFRSSVPRRRPPRDGVETIRHGPIALVALVAEAAIAASAASWVRSTRAPSSKLRPRQGACRRRSRWHRRVEAGATKRRSRSRSMVDYLQ